MSKHTPGFGICEKKGFHIRLENGWTVSIQFGSGNYGSNYDVPREEIEAGRGAQSHTAEIAAWDVNGTWYEFECDEYTNIVAGHKTPAEVIAFINQIAAMPKSEAA